MRTCLIPLSQGQSAIVDEVDYDWAMQWKWSTLNVKGAFYAVRRLAGTNKTILLHRDFSMPVKPDKFMPKTVATPVPVPKSTAQRRTGAFTTPAADELLRTIKLPDGSEILVYHRKAKAAKP